MAHKAQYSVFVVWQSGSDKLFCRLIDAQCRRRSTVGFRGGARVRTKTTGSNGNGAASASPVTRVALARISCVYIIPLLSRRTLYGLAAACCSAVAELRDAKIYFGFVEFFFLFSFFSFRSPRCFAKYIHSTQNSKTEKQAFYNVSERPCFVSRSSSTLIEKTNENNESENIFHFKKNLSFW